MFLEMSRDQAHGGGAWEFTRCLWAPTRKSDGTKWVFWTKILDVHTDDLVLHLRGVPPQAFFVGYSCAIGDGYETRERPPNPGAWSYAESFYRADLDQFVAFDKPVNLTDVFSSRRAVLDEYFIANKKRRIERQNLFYVQQSGRLQCLNGAYLSDMDETLFLAIFGDPAPQSKNSSLPLSVETGQQLATVLSRIGQTSFSKKLRTLYGSGCCFPSCAVTDRRFLVGSHIARWSDNRELRGHLGNGLCLCLMHDKAFELGLFTLDDKFRVYVSPKIKPDSTFAIDLLNSHGVSIKLAQFEPLKAALCEHWKRVNLTPISS